MVMSVLLIVLGIALAIATTYGLMFQDSILTSDLAKATGHLSLREKLFGTTKEILDVPDGYRVVESEYLVGITKDGVPISGTTRKLKRL
jgi:hypothetical protein